MKVFITKYALTKGILEKDVEQFCESGIYYKDGDYTQHIHKPYWHEELTDAILHANSMRDKAINANKKRISKLEKLRFQ